MLRTTALHALAVLIGATQLSAQTAEVVREFEPHWEAIVNSGTVVPTGAQRSVIGRGRVTAAQLSYVPRQGVALTASFGWTRTRDVARADEPRLDMFTYDVGVELRADRWLDGGTLSFGPFAGLGAGGRSYNYRSLDVDATHSAAGYVSAGGEVGIGSRVKVRLEARDYIAGFRPLTGGGPAHTRNDLTVMAGLRLRVR